ncbi:hypothetical protein QMO56_18010 [Roseomonas sp. E05]|uniref:glucosamine inositolphosphorylceramide transferase family protein n=1 Tax=Roseomonas sp. E05 TaxID=3046310 RepID=UPI0024BB8D24|nr:hypothetical protein [Roseomonas sp. E05]MDJ0390006.1 hypothetical protein [Roseomonas sp. E05]
MLQVIGADDDSPLLTRLRAAVGPGFTVSAAGAAAPAPHWQSVAGDAGLGWLGTSPDAPPAAAMAGDVVWFDPHGVVAEAGARLWRIVDAAGRPFLAPFFGRDRCYQSDGLCSIFLVERREADGGWRLLGEAHLAARQAYPMLLQAVAKAAMAMIAAALRHPEPGAAWQPLPASRRIGEAVRWRLAHGWQRLHDKATAEHWGIGLLDNSAQEMLAGGVVTASRWISLPPGTGFLADPFPWPGRPGMLLCERFEHITGLGRLQAVHVASASEMAAPEAEDLPLSFSGHLSYPFTWSEAGRVYCLPEMAASGRQVLYELCPGEPPRPAAMLADDLGMADATLFRHEGRYWIAYTDTGFGLHDNLCLMFAEQLTGPWTQHPGNPVKVDVRSARCGGNIIRSGDALIRPAQDCARGYGTALVLNRIAVCTPDRYSEEVIATLRPDPAGPYPHGLHTLTTLDGLAVIDGKRIVLDPGILLRRIWRIAMPRLRHLALRQRSGSTIGALGR